MVYDEMEMDNNETRIRTILVGNLHPKVSPKNMAELFYQVGPIEYVEFVLNERGFCENLAFVVFKYPMSVDDGIRLMNGTKLYGMPIEITKFSINPMDHSQHFRDELNDFKQLMNAKRNNQSNDRNKLEWKDRSPERRTYMPEGSFDCHAYNSYSNQDDYDHKSDSMPGPSRHQNGNSYSRRRNSDYRNHYKPYNRSHQSRERHRKSERGGTSNSMEMSYDDQNSNHNRNQGGNYHDYNASRSSNRRERSYRDQGSSMVNENNDANNMRPRTDQRCVLYKRQSNNYRQNQ